MNNDNPTLAPASPDFGDYVTIEQKRFGAPNEFWDYKVIGRLESNTWTDVPVTPTREVQHDNCEPIILAVADNLSQEDVRRFRVADVKLRAKPTLAQGAAPAVMEAQGRADFHRFQISPDTGYVHESPRGPWMRYVDHVAALAATPSAPVAAPINAAAEFQKALDMLAGLHPGLTIDGPPMDVAERIFGAVMAEQRALKDEIANMERNLEGMRRHLGKPAASPTAQPEAGKPLSNNQRANLIMDNLGPHALTGGKMSVLQAFELGIDAAEQAHGFGNRGLA
jgi:hypothetical protein